MSDYKNLVKALRLCQFGECGCGKCYYKELKGDWCTEDNHPEFFDCDDKLKLDAAAAIEDLEARLGEAENSVERWKDMYLTKHEPKRGEWVGVSPMVDTVQCSVCGGQLFSAELETPYCPYCGAKMTEVQE